MNWTRTPTNDPLEMVTYTLHADDGSLIVELCDDEIAELVALLPKTRLRPVFLIDDAGEHRFRIVAGNGEPVAQSEGYVNRADAVHAARLIVPGWTEEVER